ncbi:MAG: hypothetical protein ACFFGZ_11825 [Candidatus Thorarchaeota archaeon]
MKDRPKGHARQFGSILAFDSYIICPFCQDISMNVKLQTHPLEEKLKCPSCQKQMTIADSLREALRSPVPGLHNVMAPPNVQMKTMTTASGKFQKLKFDEFSEVHSVRGVIPDDDVARQFALLSNLRRKTVGIGVAALEGEEKPDPSQEIQVNVYAIGESPERRMPVWKIMFLNALRLRSEGRWTLSAATAVSATKVFIATAKRRVWKAEKQREPSNEQISKIKKSDFNDKTKRRLLDLSKICRDTFNPVSRYYLDYLKHAATPRKNCMYKGRRLTEDEATRAIISSYLLIRYVDQNLRK